MGSRYWFVHSQHSGWLTGFAHAANPLRGRAGELHAVLDHLATRRGALVVGAPGAGRTRLARDAVAGLTDHIVWSTATASAAGTTAGALAHLLPTTVDAVGLYGGELLGPVAGALDASSVGRTVLVVDDAHLLDADGAQLVHDLVLDAAAVVVLTARSDVAVREVIRGLVDDDVIGTVALEPLHLQAVAEIVSDLAGHELPIEEIGRLWRYVGGNLVDLRELVGSLDPAAGVESLGAWGDGRAPPMTDRLVELVECRLAELPVSWRHALEVLSLGEPMPRAILGNLVDADVLAGLEHRGLVEPHGHGSREQVAVAPPVVSDVVRNAIAPARRVGLVRRLGTELRRSGAERRDDLLRLAAWHLDDGTSIDAELMTRAAHLASWSFDPSLGERLANVALAAGGGPAATAALARALVAQGRFDDAVAAIAVDWERALLADPVEVARPVVQQWVLALDRGLGRPLEACEVLDRVAAVELDAGWPLFVDALRADVLRRVDRSEAARIAARVTRSADDPLARLLAARPLVERLSCDGRTDDALEVLDGLAATVRAAEEQMATAYAVEAGTRAGVLGDAGRLADLDTTMQAVLERATRDGDDITIGGARMGLGIGAFHGGRMALARDHLEVALRYLDAADPYGLRPWATSVLTAVCAVLGDRDATVAALHQSRAARDAEPHNTFLTVWMATGEAWAATLLDGAAAGADLALSAAVDLDSTVGRALLGALAHRLGAPDGDSVSLMALGRGAQSLLLRALADHADALIAGRPADALECVAESYRGTGYLLHAAETWIEAAEAHRRDGRLRRARTAEQHGRDLFTGPLLGATTPISMRMVAPVLTDRERQVAFEAARGLSNPQIAELLGRSVRTVESHLQQAYMKLGVHDRIELASALRIEQPRVDR